MNIPQSIFLSDAHLGAGDPRESQKREELLVRFLREKLSPGDRLFIVGDLFDFWFEYRTVIPKNHILMLSCLKELTSNGVKIDYIAGNHDFWVGNFFKKELGLSFHPEPLYETIDDKNFLIIHGDGLKKKDKGYRFLKMVFRSRLNIFLYRWIHPDIGIPFAKLCSGSSRKYSELKEFPGYAEYIKFSEKKFEEGIDFIVMGHTHEPFIQRFGIVKAYLNTGNWYDDFSYIRFYNGEITLETYRPDNW